MHEEVGNHPENPVRPLCPLPEAVGPEGEEHQGEEKGEDEEESESREVIFRKPPKGPTAGEVSEHRKTHLPFRPWCPVCVRGRGKNWGHFKAKAEKEEERCPAVCFDYCFLRDHSGGPTIPVLVGKDRQMGTLLAHAVPEKGAGLEWTAKQVCRDLVKFGIGGQVVLKGDQEPALVSVIEDVVKQRGGGRTVPEYSPVGESQANGVAERGVQTIEGLVRSHKLDLEEKIGAAVPIEKPIIAWLIEHCADIHNKFHVYADGKTSFEKVKGKKHRGEFLEFGQKVLHKVPGKPRGGLMATRWLPGIWLGKRFSSEEHIVAMDGGKVVRARAVRSLPEASMWCKDEVMGVIGVPWQPSGTMDGDGSRLPEVPRVTIREEEEEEAPKVRSAKIMPKHIVKVGYTKGCPKCTDLRNGTQELTRRGHSVECRKRIEEELRNDEELRKDVEKAEKRKDEYLSKQIEQEVGADEKRRKVEKPSEEVPGETPLTGGASGSGSEVVVTQPVDVPVPDDEGDIELEDAEGNISEEPMGTKRAREEGDDGGEDQPPAICRQLPALEEKRKREEDAEREEERGKSARKTEREGYALDLEKLRQQTETLDILGLSEKQWRTQGVSQVDVAELFSPPRTAERARQRGLKGGWSLDKEVVDPWTGKTWDLSGERAREAARSLLKKTKPKLLIVSPPCTMFSQMQRISGGPKDKVKYEEAVKLLELAVEMCFLQARAGRMFLFEHPAFATSWRLPCLERLRDLQGAQEVVFHMCRFGMQLRDQEGEGPVYKPTRICTNSMAIAGKTNLRCQGGHRHVRLESGRPALAARYPLELQDAFIDGMLVEDAKRNGVEAELLQLATYPDMCDADEEEAIRGSLTGVDDVTGKSLDPVLIQKGRAEEMRGFKDFNVYEYELREVAERDMNGKFVGTRWVDTNKGTEESPEVRCRLVGQEFAKGEVRDDLFAATPPLTATRLMLSALASRGRKGPGSHRVMLLDVKKAFLYGLLKRTVYIELPEEDEKAKTGKYVGKLRKAMYGLRDAPQIWQGEVKRTMEELGFHAIVSTPCVYINRVTGVRAVAHVDDFMCTGPKEALRQLLIDLEKRYQMKAKVLGPGGEEEREGKFLGRTVRWTKEGLEWEGDQKLRKVLIEEWGMERSSAVITPGVKEDREKIGEEVEIADKKRIARFRRGAAQVNYMSLDNPKLGFASKEISRGMAKPTEADERKLKRLVRYMQHEKGVKYVYPWQDEQQSIVGHADSDWAGCLKTRRSTSGGTLMIGSHLLAHWARTQVGVALSSGEAELNAALKVGCEAIGLQVMAEELEIKMRIELLGDSSAAKGTLSRQGSGKVKHLETKQLWMQEKISNEVIKYDKIPRSKNFADAFTHYWTAEEGLIHFRKMNIQTVTY